MGEPRRVFVGAFQPDLRRWRRCDDVWRSLACRMRAAACCSAWRLLSGAAFEWFAGWFWENAFGIVAWDYSSQPFNLGGHTCLGIALVLGSCRCGVGEAGVAGDAARSRYGPQCMACAASLGIAGVFPGGYGCDVRGIRLLDEPFGRRRARRRRAAPLRCALRR